MENRCFRALGGETPRGVPGRPGEAPGLAWGTSGRARGRSGGAREAPGAGLGSPRGRPGTPGGRPGTSGGCPGERLGVARGRPQAWGRPGGARALLVVDIWEFLFCRCPRDLPRGSVFPGIAEIRSGPFWTSGEPKTPQEQILTFLLQSVLDHSKSGPNFCALFLEPTNRAHILRVFFCSLPIGPNISREFWSLSIGPKFVANNQSGPTFSIARDFGNQSGPFVCA